MRFSLVELPFLFYRAVISPWIHLIAGPGFGCRFQPTCSHYAQESLKQHGLFRGSLLAGRRLCRCHPYSGAGGLDPVPLPDRM